MYKLKFIDDEGVVKRFEVDKDEITIGRKENNDIVLQDRNISRYHARFFKKDDGWYIEDVKSRYGVYVNGVRISEPYLLTGHDKIKIGSYEVEFLFEKKRKEGTPREVLDRELKEIENKEMETSLIDISKVQDKEEKVFALDENEIKKIVCISGQKDFKNKSYIIDKSVVYIGRTEENDIVLPHKSISRRHAKIVYDNGNFFIYDLDSANGIKVNSEPYKRATLKLHDVITLGHLRFQFLNPQENVEFDLEPKPFVDGFEEEIFEEGKKGSPVKYIVGGIVVLIAILATVVYVLKFHKTPEERATEKEKKQQQKVVTTPGVKENKAKKSVVAPKKVSSKDLLKKGITLFNHGEWDKAYQLLMKVKKLEENNATPESFEAQKYLGKIERERQAYNLYSKIMELKNQGKVEEAYSIYTKQISDINSETKYYPKLTKLGSEIKQLYVNETIKKIEQLIASDDRDSIEKGIALAKKIRKIDKDNQKLIDILLQASDKLAKLPAKKKKPSIAITAPKKYNTKKKVTKEVEKKETKKPELSASELYKLATKAKQAGKINEAINYYKTAATKYNHAPSHLALAKIYEDKRNYKKALFHYKAANKIMHMSYLNSKIEQLEAMVK